jgi:CotH kinase protein
MPRDDDWVLQGPYGDKTLMRNVVAYRTARSLGHYASRTRFVEAVINDDFRGVFVLMEPPELGERRVAASNDDVTGGYLVEMTAPHKVTEGDASFASVTGQRLVHADPEPDDMGPRRTRWIRRHLRAFEAALYGPAFADPARGWRAYLDERSAVDHVLLHELTKNEDAFHASLFVHKASGAKLRLGPAWDFDIAMGNSDFGESARLEGWMTAGRPWSGRLLQDPGFARAVAARWRELRAAGLREHLLDQVDANAARLRAAQVRNFERWPILGTRVWPNPVVPATGRPPPDYRSEVAALRAWISVRVAWIDANVAGLAP